MQRLCIRIPWVPGVRPEDHGVAAKGAGKIVIPHSAKGYRKMMRPALLRLWR